MTITYLAVIWNEFGQSMENEYPTYAAARKAVRLAIRAEIWRFNTLGNGTKIWSK